MNAVSLNCPAATALPTLRHAQVETVEPLHAVAIGQLVVDRLHDGDCLFDGLHWRAVEEPDGRHLLILRVRALHQYHSSLTAHINTFT